MDVFKELTTDTINPYIKTLIFDILQVNKRNKFNNARLAIAGYLALGEYRNSLIEKRDLHRALHLVVIFKTKPAYKTINDKQRMTTIDNANDKGKSGEDFVNQIAFSSFLKHWCFPGPLDIIGDNKEICDLLVVFDHVCMIVSVKNYSFKGDYERYFKKTIEKAIRQIDGAERKLFRDKALLLKHPDRDAELFEKENIKEIYRIIINLNGDVKYYQTSHFKDGKNYTIMDATAWYTSMEELNTLPDVTAYLTARCKLFNKYPAFVFPRSEYDISTNDKISAQAEIETASADGKITLVLGSELDLIAQYILNAFKFPENLNHNEVNGLLLKLDGQWDKFLKSKISTQKDEYEKESYFIDRLVKQFLIHTENGNHLTGMFFRLNRLERAEFARAFLNYHEGYAMGDINIKLNRSHFVLPFINMVFIYHDDDYPREQLTEIVNMSLHHHHYLNNFKCKEVGALGMSRTTGDFTFGYSKLIEPYTQEEINEMKESFRSLGWQIEQLTIRN
ncbi:hypothetical protein [Mucilaginibacter sp.]|uniref:hypothetical protein n=1 Tax=Mucilaginibacter sp. TaxID=1882438 RepID=UPI00261F512B|nr:hypothetical protein [Mucilaginibacter sp.]MDB4926601.1 hypothetical protein [Mucilaginibacter sp.]